jgi:outer membrane biogenesis lipoprotein LolB
MIRFLALIVCLCLIAGCVHVPFKETERISMESVDPKNVVARFMASTPDSFQLLNSVVFEYSMNTIMGIGSIDVDRKNSTFRVACLNPLGVQLFELSGDRNSIVTHSAMPGLLEFGNLPQAVGMDIRRIYFDLVPSDNAWVWKSRYGILFWQWHGPGYMEYEFGGSGQDLVEKAYYENDEKIWRISYYEYREENGKRYPQGIIMINYKYGYQLTVRLKELYS